MIPRPRLIRGWLLQMPRPAAVRISSGDDTHMLEVGTQKWAQVAASIEALDPDKIEALDAQGKLLRAIKAEQLEDPSDDSEESTAAAGETKRDSKQLEREMVMLTKFGELLADAYKHSTSVAFGKMVELFDASNRRGDALEKSLSTTEKLLRRAYEEGARSPEEGGEPSLLESMLNAFASGQTQSSVEQKIVKHVAKTPTNGKAQI